MKTSPFFLGLALLIVITAAITAYSGFQTGRWMPLRGLEESRKLLRELPMTIGDWTAEEELELFKQDTAQLQIEDGYIYRKYQNVKTQAEVHLVIMVGKTGLVVVHTPEVCFGGRNYEKADTRSVETFPIAEYSGSGPTDDSFWKVDFINRAVEGGTISFYYGVSVDGAWLAAENPRVSLRHYRYAYRLQAQAAVDGDTDNVRDFLHDILPTLHEFIKPCR